MNNKQHLAWTRAASQFVRNQPSRFAGAAQWVTSFKPEKGMSKKSAPESSDSVAYRTIEALVLHFRALLDKQSLAPLPSKQDACRVILTSWLLAEEAHDPYVQAGSLHDSADRHPCLQDLPVLDGREFMRLTIKYAHAADPRWHELVVAAWKVVDDPGYLRRIDDTEPPTTSLSGPKQLKIPSGMMSPRVDRARASYDWARKHAPKLFGDTGNKYPQTAFNLVVDPKNGCPAYSGKKPPISHQTWERYIRLSEKSKPIAD